MNLLYILAVWAHVFTACFWIGAMFFADPESTRFFSKLFERRLKGVGWYAQGVLWPTGIFMVHYRGYSLGDLVSADVLASSWGQLLWLKIALALTLIGLQLTVGNRPSRLVYGYIILAFLAVGVGVLLARPGLT
jgi:hypothetical protein